MFVSLRYFIGVTSILWLSLQFHKKCWFVRFAIPWALVNVCPLFIISSVTFPFLLFPVYFVSCEVTSEINTKTIIRLAHKQFVTPDSKFLTRHSERIKDDQMMIPHIDSVLYLPLSTFCWWHHNRLCNSNLVQNCTYLACFQCSPSWAHGSRVCLGLFGTDQV